MMFISQSTRDHEYSCKQPSWYQSGQKQSHYRQTNIKKCPPDCTYGHKELIAQHQYGKVKIENEPIDVDKRVKGSLQTLPVKVDAEYENKTNYKDKDNPKLIISGNGKYTQTIHYIDQKCPQYNKKKQQNQSSGTGGNDQTSTLNNETDNYSQTTHKASQDTKTSQQFKPSHQSNATHDSKTQSNKQSNSSKGNKGGEVLALAAVAVGGYIGSYYILKKSFQQENQRPKHQQGKAVGNVIVQSTCATGGAVGGGVYGASIGAVAGPVGAFIGAGLGMLAGSALGYGLKKIMPWNW